MLSRFLTWWFACLSGLVARIGAAVPWAARAAIVITPDDQAVLRGRRVSLGAAARLADRCPVVLRPEAGSVLTCRHDIPAASNRDVADMLRHELSRITPFAPEELVWHWRGGRKAGAPDHMVVTVSMVPKAALAPVLARLERAGIRPDAVELDGARVRLRAPQARSRLVPALGGVCAVLAVAALAFPTVLQELALQRAAVELKMLRGAVGEAEALRQGIAAREAKRVLLAREAAQVGDLLQGLARVTEVLPDDTFLTNLVVQGRRLTLSGRSASAARLISILAGDQAIRDPAFAAPVLRESGGDVFLITAALAP